MNATHLHFEHLFVLERCTLSPSEQRGIIIEYACFVREPDVAQLLCLGAQLRTVWVRMMFGMPWVRHGNNKHFWCLRAVCDFMGRCCRDYVFGCIL